MADTPDLTAAPELPEPVDTIGLPVVARLYYGGSPSRRYKRASTLPGPGEPLMFVSTAREYMRRRDAMWQDRVRKAVAVERERCALVCENLGKPTYFGGASHMGAFIATAPQCAAAIRKG